MNNPQDESSRMHLNATWPPTGRARRTVIGIAAATAAAGTIMVLAAGTDTASAAPKAHKFYVCKYVGTPGDNERLQTGQNPIVVDRHAIAEDPVVVGSFFNDKQGRSFVLASFPQDPEPSAADCPPVTTPSTTPPTTPVTTPTTPVTTPVTTPTTPVTTPTTPVSTPPTHATSGTSAHQHTSPATHSQAATSTTNGPIPQGVSAGLHTPIANAGLKAWGIVLMLLGGAAGLLAGLWPTRRRAH